MDGEADAPTLFACQRRPRRGDVLGARVKGVHARCAGRGERRQSSGAAADFEHTLSLQRDERGDRRGLDPLVVAPVHRYDLRLSALTADLRGPKFCVEDELDARRLIAERLSGFSPAGATALRSGHGETSDECGERVTPDSDLLAWWHHPAELDRGESFAEGVKLAGGVTCRARAKQAGVLEPAHPGLEPGEGGACSGAELAGQVG